MKNQALRGKLNAQNQDTPDHSIQSRELNMANRIREAIGEESVASFSRRVEIGDSTLRKYLDGAVPHAVNLVAIADAANVNIEWLAAGRGPKLRGASAHIPMIPQAPPIEPSIINIEDIHRLTLAIEAVEEGLGKIYSTVPADKRAKLVAAAYDLLIDLDQKDNVVKFVKLAA